MDAGATSPAATDWDFWSQGLDRQFFMRVYKRSTQITVVAALLFLAFDQRQVALGLLSGAAAGMFSLWTTEATVRLLFRGGAFPGLKLAVGAILKMPLMLGGLVGIAWAAFHGFMNIFGVVAGVLLVHGTMFCTVIATAMASEDYSRERYHPRRRR